MIKPISPTSTIPSRKEARKNALSKQLKSMTFDAFYDLLLVVYITILHCLQRATIVHGIISSVIKDAEASGLVIGSNSAKSLDLTFRSPTPTSPLQTRSDDEEDDDDFDDVPAGNKMDQEQDIALDITQGVTVRPFLTI